VRIVPLRRVTVTWFPQILDASVTKGHVHGLISLTEPADAWPVALRRVARGGFWMSEPLLNRLLRQTRTAIPAQPLLSGREREVLRLAAARCANKEIARRLGIAERTVEFHLGNIRQKLKVATRLEAILWFNEQTTASG
jgi:DNA-binding NarL/FixJ family response regulator